MPSLNSKWRLGAISAAGGMRGDRRRRGRGPGAEVAGTFETVPFQKTPTPQFRVLRTHNSHMHSGTTRHRCTLHKESKQHQSEPDNDVALHAPTATSIHTVEPTRTETARLGPKHWLTNQLPQFALAMMDHAPRCKLFSCGIDLAIETSGLRAFHFLSRCLQAATTSLFA
jgi:hypothetical protein